MLTSRWLELPTRRWPSIHGRKDSSIGPSSGLVFVPEICKRRAHHQYACRVVLIMDNVGMGWVSIAREQTDKLLIP
jgi:hypothetical protein